MSVFQKREMLWWPAGSNLFHAVIEYTKIHRNSPLYCIQFCSSVLSLFILFLSIFKCWYSPLYRFPYYLTGHGAQAVNCSPRWIWGRQWALSESQIAVCFWIHTSGQGLGPKEMSREVASPLKLPVGTVTAAMWLGISSQTFHHWPGSWMRAFFSRSF